MEEFNLEQHEAGIFDLYLSSAVNATMIGSQRQNMEADEQTITKIVRKCCKFAESMILHRRSYLNTL